MEKGCEEAGDREEKQYDGAYPDDMGYRRGVYDGVRRCVRGMTRGPGGSCHDCCGELGGAPDRSRSAPSQALKSKHDPVTNYTGFGRN